MLSIDFNTKHAYLNINCKLFEYKLHEDGYFGNIEQMFFCWEINYGKLQDDEYQQLAL